MSTKITDQIDRITRISAQYMGVHIPAPRSVKIEVSPRCNYRCRFCALRTRKKQPTADIDINLFKRITTEMREAGVQEIGLFYLGESLVNPELTLECLWHCKEVLEFPYVFLTTNGSLASPDVVKGLMEGGLDSLKFSINNADAGQFHKITQVKPMLHRTALENLRKAREIRDTEGYRTRIYASSIQYDGEQAEKMNELLDEFVRPYVDQHYFLPLYGVMVKGDNGEVDKDFKPTPGNQGRIGALRDPLPCWAVFTEGHVRADGLLSACCFDSDGRFTMADLNEVSFLEGWNSPKFQELRAAHLKKDVCGTICEKCVLV